MKEELCTVEGLYLAGAGRRGAIIATIRDSNKRTITAGVWGCRVTDTHIFLRITPQSKIRASLDEANGDPDVVGHPARPRQRRLYVRGRFTVDAD